MQTATPISYEEFKAAKDICEAATCNERQRLDAPNEEAGGFVVHYDPSIDPWSKDKYIFVDTATQTQELYNVTSANYIVVTSLEYTVESPSAELFSPFDKLDEKLPSEEKVKKLLRYLFEHTEIPFAQKITFRLKYLIEELKDDPDGESISFESVRNFVSFIRNTRNLKYPDIILTPMNEICAQWRTDPNRHFSVIFQPTGDVQFVIFKPRSTDPDKVDRLSGITSIDLLIETVEPYNVLTWTCE